jgi:hypothetical protein
MFGLLVITLAHVNAIVQDQPPIVPEIRPGKDGRGRDPWVFRLIFEDHTRMVAVALRDDFWYVFNPETCAPFKVWSGKMDFRGKVWDFSQDNSRAQGNVHSVSPTEIASLPNGDLDDWTAKGVAWDKSWRFTGDGATLTSPPIDLSVWQRVFIAFDEQSRKGRLKVDISDDGGKTWGKEFFYSATSVTNDTDWQWNFKQVLTKSPTTVIRLTQERALDTKTVRNVRVFGDQPSWLDRDGNPIPVRWRGYEITGETKSVSMLFDLDLPSGHSATVRFKPESEDGQGWSELISIRGLKPGDYVFYAPLSIADGKRTIFLPDGSRREDNVRWPFGLATDGDVLIKYEVGK